jgi:hypothetical protein
MNKGDDIPKEVISELDSASRQLDAELAGEASGPSGISMRILYGDKGSDSPLEDVSR